MNDQAEPDQVEKTNSLADTGQAQDHHHQDDDAAELLVITETMWT